MPAPRRQAGTLATGCDPAPVCAQPPQQFRGSALDGGPGGDLTLEPEQDRVHATHAQRADDLREAHPVVEVGGDTEDLLGGRTVESGVEDPGEPAGGRCLRRAVEVEGDVAVPDVGGEEERRNFR